MKIWACFIAHRNLGNLIHGILQKYPSQVKKTELDLNLLSNCYLFNVTLKFLVLNLPYSNDEDTRFIRKGLLGSAIKKWKDERRKLEKGWEKIIWSMFHIERYWSIYHLKFDQEECQGYSKIDNT